MHGSIGERTGQRHHAGPNPGLEQIIEAYYSYAINASTKISFDYQYIANPSYNNVFAGRFHWQF